jgi:hypothetical protein
MALPSAGPHVYVTLHADQALDDSLAYLQLPSFAKAILNPATSLLFLQRKA